MIVAGTNLLTNGTIPPRCGSLITCYSCVTGVRADEGRGAQLQDVQEQLSSAICADWARRERREWLWYLSLPGTLSVPPAPLALFSRERRERQRDSAHTKRRRGKLKYNRFRREEGRSQLLSASLRLQNMCLQISGEFRKPWLVNAGEGGSQDSNGV